VAGKDAIEQIPAGRNFCKLEGDSTGVADYPCAVILISRDCSPEREAEAVVEWEAENSPVADY
jgi:hypothetical protein